MCGRLNVIDDYGVQQLCRQLRIPLGIPESLSRRFVRATEPVAIVTEREGQRQLETATWWLLLEPTETGFKPSKYTSFNTRYDKLNVPRSAGFQAFRQSRCIIPAKGFGESEFKNKKPLHYHDFQADEGEAIAFGGLYRDWVHRGTGEVRTSCSIITLPPHPKLTPYHSKSMPLILPQTETILDAWLSKENTDVNWLSSLLQPHLPQALWAQQIDKPSHYQPIADPLLLAAD